MMEPKPPRYHWGQVVSATADLFNDGSHPEAPANARLVEAGAMGEILKVGTHADTNTHVYLVEFNEKVVVGCFENEIKLI
jgi:nitrogen fixation protein NifZ